jgi:hypothetical protein
VATGVASGVAAVTNNCNYYYRQWRLQAAATGAIDTPTAAFISFLGGPELERRLVGSADLVVLDHATLRSAFSGHKLTCAKHAARAGYQVRLYRPVLSSEGERRDHETPGVTKGSDGE